MDSNRGAKNVHLEVACLVLVDPSGCFLAMRRPLTKALGGKWEFPGGKLEESESAESALKREILEEIGIHIELAGLVPLEAATYTYPFAVIKLIPFLLRCPERPTCHLLEHSDFCWLNLEERISIDWAPADLPILDQLSEIL